MSQTKSDPVALDAEGCVLIRVGSLGSGLWKAGGGTGRRLRKFLSMRGILGITGFDSIQLIILSFPTHSHLQTTQKSSDRIAMMC